MSRISECTYEGICVIRAEGAVTLALGARAFMKLLGLRIEEGFRSIILDFSEVTLTDSTGLGGLVSGLARSRSRSGTMFVIPSPNVSTLLKITRLESVFETVADMPEAVSKILGRPIQMLPPLQYVEQYSAIRKGEGEDAETIQKDNLEPTSPSPTPPTKPDSSHSSLLVATGSGLAIFAVTIAMLVWTAKQISSLPVLVLIFSVAIIFDVLALVLILRFSGHLSEKSASRLFGGALAKVPRLKAWVPGASAGEKKT